MASMSRTGWRARSTASSTRWGRSSGFVVATETPAWRAVEAAWRAKSTPSRTLLAARRRTPASGLWCSPSVLRPTVRGVAPSARSQTLSASCTRRMPSARPWWKRVITAPGPLGSGPVTTCTSHSGCSRGKDRELAADVLAQRLVVEGGQLDVAHVPTEVEVRVVDPRPLAVLLDGDLAEDAELEDGAVHEDVGHGLARGGAVEEHQAVDLHEVVGPVHEQPREVLRLDGCRHGGPRASRARR